MHILIIKPSSLGDIVHGLQVVAILKKQISNLTIDWVVRDCFASIVAASGLVNRIHLYSREAGVAGFFKLLGTIRKQRYDATLDMQGLARSGIMTFASRSRRKIGRHDSREFSSIFYREKIMPAEGAHAVDVLLQFLPKFGLMPEFEYDLDFDLGRYSYAVEEPYVLLFPESRRTEKQWPFFYELAKNLADRYGDLRFVIAGEHAADMENFRENILNLTGKTSLKNLLNLINYCDFLIANDSAPTHIGAAMRKNLLAIFGPTDVYKHGPYPLECARHTVISAQNLANLSVQKVFDAAVSGIDNFLRSR
jgi:ADP-heptose:LPS heptosyltransferase